MSAEVLEKPEPTLDYFRFTKLKFPKKMKIYLFLSLLTFLATVTSVFLADWEIIFILFFFFSLSWGLSLLSFLNLKMEFFLWLTQFQSKKLAVVQKTFEDLGESLDAKILNEYLKKLDNN